MPILSIIIPSYNHANLLSKAIQSVKEQSFSDWELIIIDDGSTDDTKEIVHRYSDSRIKYYFQNNQGVATAMNNGFNHAVGNYFAWLDADNYYNKDTFRIISDSISNNKSVDIFFGNISLFNDKENLKILKPNKTLSYNQLMINTSGAVPLQPGVFFKKELFTKSEGFNTKYKISGDIDFWIKVFKLNPTYLYINKTFGFYYLDDSGISQGIKGVQNGLKEMRIILNEHNQHLYGRIMMELKYFWGYTKTIISSIIK